MKWLILTTLIATWVKHQPTLEVKVTGGWVRGSLGPGGVYHQFLGIPYAYTDHEGRFKAPQKVRPWNGVYDAIEENVECPQNGLYFKGQENCLRINVYVPLNIEKPLPVMVFIHGGGFFEGSGAPSMYGPDYIVSKDVILVTFNYRLNIQGFMCLGIEEAPGNAAMKDQVAALKWVQDNIRAFGGDKDHVTIFGESAGGASVSFHLLSPMSTGLFHRAILQSGSSLGPWVLQMKPVYLTSLLAKSMGFNTQDPHELYKYLMKKSDRELVLTRVPRSNGSVCISEVLYNPCVEKLIPGVEPFLTDNPYNLLSKGEYNKVPVMLGFNDKEGLFFAGLENDTIIPQLRFDRSMPENLIFPNESASNAIAEQFRRLYMGDDEISKETTAKWAKLHGEPYFILPTLMETQLLAATSDQPIYSYKFAYGGLLNWAKIISGFRHLDGATHADDLFYLFKPRLIPTPARFFEREMLERMTTLWTNFAKYGDPTPELSDLLPLRWSQVKKESPEALVIAQDLKMEPMWYSDTLVLWNQTYNKYRRKDIPW